MGINTVIDFLFSISYNVYFIVLHVEVVERILGSGLITEGLHGMPQKGHRTPRNIRYQQEESSPKTVLVVSVVSVHGP